MVATLLFTLDDSKDNLKDELSQDSKLEIVDANIAS